MVGTAGKKSTLYFSIKRMHSSGSYQRITMALLSRNSLRFPLFMAPMPKIWAMGRHIRATIGLVTSLAS